MKITVNGEPHMFEKITNLFELVENLGFANKPIAVALNMSHVPKQKYECTKIKEGDEIEILSPMQGG